MFAVKISDPKTSPPKNDKPKIDVKSEMFAVKITESNGKISPPKKIVSPPRRDFTPKETKNVTSPPVLISKLTRVNSIVDEKSVQKTFKPDVSIAKVPKVEATPPEPVKPILIPQPIKPGLVPEMAKPAFVTAPLKPAHVPEPVKPFIDPEPVKSAFVPVEPEKPRIVPEMPDPPPPISESENAQKNDETNGVGDKIKIFEKAAENAATSGRLSRAGSVRRPRAERLPSDELPPPPTSAEMSPSPATVPFERQPSLPRNDVGSITSRWPRDDTEEQRPRIVRPEFRPLASPAEVTIRSPSLGAKIPDRFPSHGTAFRNVAATNPAPVEEPDEHVKSCKSRKDKCSVSRGSSYFTRGSEEIWLVKKKDIEAIEERVLDSLRRSGGPPSGNGSQTLGRGRRQMYTRSESLEPASAGPRAHTLKRQSSVACTCGHDKKTRAKSADSPAAPPRLRSRSHGDENPAHVLDKYETLV